jgi:hypothetical protein
MYLRREKRKKMTNKTFINVEGILRIKVHYASKSTWSWQPTTPSRRTWFFFRTEEIPAGWTDGGYFCQRETLEDVLAKNPRLYQNLEVLPENCIWHRPWVEIEQMGGKYTNSDHLYFNTNKEAEEYAKLLALSLTTIEVVYNGK